MKHILLLIILPSLALAEDISTLSGTVYKNASITRVEPNGLVIAHEDGMAKVPFTNLSEEIQKKYGYDNNKSVKFTQEQEKKTADAFSALKSANEARVKAKEEQKQMVTLQGEIVGLANEWLDSGQQGLLIDCGSEPVHSSPTAGKSTSLARMGGGGNVEYYGSDTPKANNEPPPPPRVYGLVILRGLPAEAKFSSKSKVDLTGIPVGQFKKDDDVYWIYEYRAGAKK